MHGDVEIARRSPALARRALALESDALAIGDPGRNPYVHRPRRGAASRAVADRAWVVHDQATAKALAAWFGEREATGVGAHMSGTLTRGADTRHRSGAGSSAGAGRTR